VLCARYGEESGRLWFEGVKMVAEFESI